MPFDAFTAAVKPKVAGSWNLHRLLPENLDFFILLSSASGITGVPSQANYAAGNTYQDALARHRIMNGQKAVSLDLGVIENVGYVAERPQIRETAKKLGFLPISDTQLLALLEYHCDPNLGLLSPSTCQVITGLEVPASMLARGLDDVHWMSKSQFRSLHQMDKNISAAPSTQNAKDNIISPAVLITSSESIHEAAFIVAESLSGKLSKILSMPEENIDLTKPMHVVGVDSLVALEIRNWFARELEVDVTVFEILENRSINDLGLEVVRRSPRCCRFWDVEQRR